LSEYLARADLPGGEVKDAKRRVLEKIMAKVRDDGVLTAKERKTVAWAIPESTNHGLPQYRVSVRK